MKGSWSSEVSVSILVRADQGSAGIRRRSHSGAAPITERRRAILIADRRVEPVSATVRPTNDRSSAPSASDPSGRARSSRAAAADVENGAGAATILVVDDDASLTSMLSVVLTGEGYAVQSASDGAEALAMIEREQPDLVLSDIWMPQMSGYELVDRMISRGDRIPVVLMSGIVPESRYPRIRFLRKPFGVAEVVEAVRQAFSERGA